MGVLILLATILFTGALVAASVLFLIVGKPSLLKYVAGVWFSWLAVYALLLLGASVSSSEQLLPTHQAKRFCGFYLDCHMAAEVSSVTRQKTFKGREAKGTFLIVNVEVSSDARRAELRLVSPQFQIIDDRETRFNPVKELSTPTVEFEKRIGPTERIKGEVVFDVPESATRLRLDVQQVDPLDLAFESILIGDEDSFLHKRTFFSLNSATAGL